MDTNILMYAAGRPHPLQSVCRMALEVAIDRRVSLVTDSEVMQEILYRYFALGRPGIATTVYRAATSLCDEILAVEERHTARALELLLQSPELSPRDAIHVATMEATGLRRILSTDKDFDTIESVDRVDPQVFVS